MIWTQWNTLRFSTARLKWKTAFVILCVQQEIIPHFGIYLYISLSLRVIFCNLHCLYSLPSLKWDGFFTAVKSPGFNVYDISGDNFPARHFGGTVYSCGMFLRLIFWYKAAGIKHLGVRLPGLILASLLGSNLPGQLFR